MLDREHPSEAIGDSAPAGSPPDSPAKEECRRALRSVLDSGVLAAVRRVRKFVEYSGLAALEGREEIDQYEIARQVLERQGDFNPVEDASVRKLVSQARHKLEEYYAGEGRDDGVVVFVPSRSYVLKFRYRKGLRDVASGVSQHAEGAEDPPEPAPAAAPFRLRPYALGALAGAAPLLMVLLWQFAVRNDSLPASSLSGAILIPTERGDLRGRRNEFAPGAVRLGPAIGAGEEVTAAMRFQPAGPTQQAGIMLFHDPDHFIRLGYQFKIRTLLELGMEWQGDYLDPLATYLFDPWAARSGFTWFTLRRDRRGRVYGFVSRDGLEWKAIGIPLEDRPHAAASRAALYAFDGRTENPSVPVQFRDVSLGLSFHNRQETTDLTQWAPEWTVHSGCPHAVTARVVRDALEVAYLPEASDCNWELRKPAPAGDWTFSTVLDFMPVAGGSAGLAVQCERGKLSVSRRALSGGSILLELPWDEDVRVPDYPGWPLVVLRVTAARGRITASYSRDGERFARIPGEVALERIGKPLSVGIIASVPKWSGPQNLPPARFYRVQQEIESFHTLR